MSDPPPPPDIAKLNLNYSDDSVLLDDISAAGKEIWIKDKKEVWILAQTVSSNDKEKTVHILRPHSTSPESIETSSTAVHDPSHDLDLDDISSLNNLSEAPLLHMLKRRFDNSKIYTYCGHVLISVNPYKTIPNLYDIDLYMDQAEETGSPADIENFATRTVRSGSVAVRDALQIPHVYSLAQVSFVHMLKTSKDQSVIISGESGAGKTEGEITPYYKSFAMHLTSPHLTSPHLTTPHHSASKHVMRFLIEQSSLIEHSSGALGNQIQNRLMESNIILEAFGNAKTVRNDNSSRFGKYIKLKYDSDHKIVGASTSTFLLEKSRLINVEQNERNYHIFYQLLAGLDQPTREKFQLTTVDAYNMLSSGSCTSISEVDDADEFNLTLAALHTLGIEESDEIKSFLSALLHLGNATTSPNPDDDSRPLDVQFGASSLEFVASLFGVEALLLKNVINQRIQTSGRGSTTSIPLNSTQTIANVSALIKYGFGNLFNW